MNCDARHEATDKMNIIVGGDFPKKVEFELRVKGSSSCRRRGGGSKRFPGEHKGTFKG